MEPIKYPLRVVIYSMPTKIRNRPIEFIYAQDADKNDLTLWQMGTVCRNSRAWELLKERVETQDAMIGAIDIAQIQKEVNGE